MLLVLLILQTAQPPLNLICMGGGSANKPSIATGWAGGQTIRVFGQRQQAFADQVDVRLFSGDDRIRMPRSMLPSIHGGDDGWFKLNKVSGDERAIKASVEVNFMNNPKVHIDRVTGTISIAGKAGNYSGQCEVVDPDAKPKF